MRLHLTPPHLSLAVYQDLWWRLPVPAGGMCSRGPKWGAQLTLWLRPAASRPWKLQPTALRVRVDHRRMVWGTVLGDLWCLQCRSSRVLGQETYLPGLLLKIMGSHPIPSSLSSAFCESPWFSFNRDKNGIIMGADNSLDAFRCQQKVCYLWMERSF